MTGEPDTFAVDNFEGSLDLLWHLIQCQEIDIYEISLHQIVAQYLDRIEKLLNVKVDKGAEFIASAASLICLKSKALLPKHEQQQNLNDEDNDPGFEIIHQLMDYFLFREAAKGLTEREQKQKAFYVRGTEENEVKKNLGMDHLSLDDLAIMFRQVLAKASIQKGVIHEESWKVSDKIISLRLFFSKRDSIPFSELFVPENCRAELIVIFLALLELMKSGEVKVDRNFLLKKN